MAAPVITTVSPSEGLAQGRTFVEVVGSGFNLAAVGSVEGSIGGVAVTSLKVWSSTRITFLTPPATSLGLKDLVLTNITPQTDPTPDLEESTTEADAFEYKRPSLKTSPMSENSCLALIVRAMLADLQLKVLDNTNYVSHSEYVDADGATNMEERQAKTPSLTLSEPEIREDRFMAPNGPQIVQLSGQPERVIDQVEKVEIFFDIVGVGSDPIEAFNLQQAVSHYFARTKFLTVTTDNGDVNLEMDLVRDSRGDFRGEVGRSNVNQFTSRIRLSEIHFFEDKVDESPLLTDYVTIQIQAGLDS